MIHWLLAVIVLTLQEVVTLNALLFAAKQGHYTIWVIHLIFAVATAFDIWIGYKIGKWTKNRYTTGRIVRFANKVSERFHAFMGKRGRKIAVFLLGNFSFPYVNAFLAAWLDIPFWEAFILLYIGNIVFYVVGWLFILGISIALPNPVWGMAAVVIASLAFVLIARRMRK